MRANTPAADVAGSAGTPGLLLAVAGWVLAVVVAGAWLFAPRPVPLQQDRPVNLLDPRYPAATAGQQGYHYHESAAADLDGDGRAETVHVIARVERTGQPPPGDVAWDDGQPWQVYVEAAGGARTHLYARWVQLGRLRVMIGERGSKPVLVILEEGGAGLALYQVTFGGQGQFQAVELAQVPVLDRATPVQAGG